MQRKFFKFHQLFVVLTFQIIYQLSRNWTWLALLKLLTINFKNKSLHNCIDRLGLYLQVCNPPWLGKFFRFTVLRLLQKTFGKLFLLLWHDLIISPPCRTTTTLIHLWPKLWWAGWGCGAMLYLHVFSQF